ncbi:MAG: hypothetical protein ACRD5B_13335, partial [Nitrososphaeraceae archaeon]
TFTVEGNSLDEMEEQIRQQVNDLGLTNEQEEEIINEAIDRLEEEFPSEEAIIPRCTVTITIIRGDPEPCFFGLFTCRSIEIIYKIECFPS